jgi:hypothetical protein
MAGGGAAPAPKQEELQPHPVKDQLSNASYCINSPPPWRTSHSPSGTFSTGFGIHVLAPGRFDLAHSIPLMTPTFVLHQWLGVTPDSLPGSVSNYCFLCSRGHYTRVPALHRDAGHVCHHSERSRPPDGRRKRRFP